MDIAKLDRFMQARPAPEEGVRWLAPFEPPLVLEGFAFFEQNGAYRRLPLDSDAVFSRAGRAALTELGTNTAGGCIRFRSSTGRVLVRARLAAACAMDRAVLTAICAGRAAHGVTPGPVCSATEKPHIPPHCGAEGTGRKRNF